MKKYINPILTAGSLIALLTTIYFQNEKINQLKDEKVKISVVQGGDIVTANKIDSLTNVSDSLHAELFITQTKNGRYELTLDALKTVNPKAAKAFETYLNHETE
jgi:hypothetical protein